MAKDKNLTSSVFGAKLVHFSVPHWLLLIVLILASAAVRLYKLETPLADWHSWRQADTASVTREYVKHQHSFWQPRYHDLSNIPNGLDNLEGYRMVEFPIINWMLAQVLLIQPGADLVVTSRLASIATSLLSVACLYWISWRISGSRRVAFGAATTFALLPYSIYYSRVILPEPFMVTASLVSITSLLEWAHRRKKSAVAAVSWLALTWFSFALALLLKPSAIFFAPVLMAVPFAYYGWKAVTLWELWILPTSIFPLLGWRWWIAQYPTGIPAYTWLFNGNGIRLRPAWWRWIFADRVGRLLLGYWGAALVVPGVIGKWNTPPTPKWLFLNSGFDFITLTWLISSLAYLVVFATGNVQHDYYQIQLVPVLCLLLARGIVWLLDSAQTHHILAHISVFLVITLTLSFAWYEVKGFYNINNPAIVEAGRAVDEFTPATAKVIAPYGGDTAFLFQTNRTGWPIGGLINERIQQGATHYVTTALDDEAKQLLTKYKLVKQTDNFLLLDLTSPAEVKVEQSSY